jgi:hypothetical protein
MKKVQMYVSETKDAILYELIERLEEESEGKRGYVAEQLKERLKAFELLARTFGENDPMALALKLAAGARPEPEKPKETDEKKEGVKPDVNPDLIDIGNNAAVFAEE